MRQNSSPAAKRVLPVDIQWMIRRDMDDVLRIEAACFEHPWAKDDFLHVLRHRNCIGMTAKSHGINVGFMIYELFPRRLELLNFAVNPDDQRLRIGSQMISKLAAKLPQQRRKAITLFIRESNLTGQLFFRSHGFQATGYSRQHFDTGEDAIKMRFDLEREVKP